MPARQSRGASRNTCRPARRQNRPVPGSNGPRPAWRPSRGGGATPAPSSESPRMRPRRRTARSAGSTTVGAGSSAATTKPADSSVPMMAAAGPSTRSRPPRVQHRKVSGSSSHRWGALTLASRQYTPPASPRQHGARALSQRAAGIAEAGPECRDGAPAQPGFIEQHGQDHRRRAGGGGLQGVQPEDAAHGGAPGSGEEVKLLLRSGKGPGGREALTLPCREGRQCVFCGRSSPISRQPAGMVTSVTFAPRGQK